MHSKTTFSLLRKFKTGNSNSKLYKAFWFATDRKIVSYFRNPEYISIPFVNLEKWLLTEWLLQNWLVFRTDELQNLIFLHIFVSALNGSPSHCAVFRNAMHERYIYRTAFPAAGSFTFLCLNPIKRLKTL